MDRQLDQQTGRQTDRQADRQTGGPADRQTDRQQTGRLADRQTFNQAGRQIDRWIDKCCGCYQFWLHSSLQLWPPGASDPSLTTCKVEVTVEDLNDVPPVFVKAPLGNFIQVGQDFYTIRK